MIISHTHKFIFLKTSKTAGTSLEIAVSKYCGTDDIITPISPVDEEIRRGLGFRTAQNFIVPLHRYSVRNWLDAFKKGGRLRFYNHMPAWEVRRIIGGAVWESYYKFCFERSPWERFISMYYWRFKQEPRPTISEFMESGALDILKQKGAGIYMINGRIAVDKIYRFEDREEALEDIRERLGLPEALSLPKAKSGFRADRRPYHEILSSDEIQRIAEKFSDEISRFGYSSG